MPEKEQIDWLFEHWKVVASVAAGAFLILLSLLANTYLPGRQASIERRRRGPKLDVAYDPNDLKCWRETTEQLVQPAPASSTRQATTTPFPASPLSRPVLYLSVRIKNILPNTAKSSRAFLTKIERWENDRWVTKYEDSLPIIWAFEPLIQTKDIAMGPALYANVVAIRQPNNSFEPQLYSGHSAGNPLRPTALIPIVNKSGEHQLTVVVSADGIEPQTVRVRFDCNGQYPWPKRYA